MKVIKILEDANKKHYKKTSDGTLLKYQELPKR